MRFLIYDVETAQSTNTGSICSVGWILYDNDRLVDEGYSLINPHCRFSSQNTAIHGITSADVADAPSFSEYWKSVLQPMVKSAVLVAHNAKFDVSATVVALTDSGEDIPGFYYLDSLSVFRHYVDSDSYKLKNLANKIGFEYNPHNALEDCHALAQLLFRVRDLLECSDLAELFLCSPVRCENTMNDSFPSRAKKASAPFVHYSHCDKNVEVISDRLSGSRFCITGDIPGYDRAEIEKMITENGGVVTSCVSGKTNYLIVGKYELYPDDYISTKHRTALDLISAGKNIRILKGNDFFSLLNE